MLGSHPIDTVKVHHRKLEEICIYTFKLNIIPMQVRIQSQGSGDIPLRYQNGRQAFKDILKTEGVCIYIISTVIIVLASMFYTKHYFLCVGERSLQRSPATAVHTRGHQWHRLWC